MPFGRFSDSPMVDLCFDEVLGNSGSSTIETKSKGKELQMEIGNQYFLSISDGLLLQELQVTPSMFNIAPENGGWKTTFLLGREFFQGLC